MFGVTVASFSFRTSDRMPPFGPVSGLPPLGRGQRQQRRHEVRPDAVALGPAAPEGRQRGAFLVLGEDDRARAPIHGAPLRAQGEEHLPNPGNRLGRRARLQDNNTGWRPPLHGDPGLERRQRLAPSHGVGFSGQGQSRRAAQAFVLGRVHGAPDGPFARAPSIPLWARNIANRKVISRSSRMAG